MDLGGWLRSLGLERYEAAFRENQIDDTVLPNLTAEDLKDPQLLKGGDVSANEQVRFLIEHAGRYLGRNNWCRCRPRQDGPSGRIDLQIEEVSMSQTDALEKLKKREIAATVLIAGKPARSIQRLSPDDGLHGLPIPYLPALAADYLPASLSHEDYPNMISAGQEIDTVAVGAVLIAYNWPKNTYRYRRVQRFVEAFFPRVADFRDPPRHPKWREVTLAATLDGWDRFEPAQTWVEAHKSQQASSLPVSSGGPQPTKGPEVPPGVDPVLFQKFLEWRRSTGGKQ